MDPKSRRITTGVVVGVAAFSAIRLFVSGLTATDPRDGNMMIFGGGWLALCAVAVMLDALAE